MWQIFSFFYKKCGKENDMRNDLRTGFCRENRRKKIEGRRANGWLGKKWRWRSGRTMIDGEGDIEKEGGVGPNVCMDFFVLTEYLVMSRLS